MLAGRIVGAMKTNEENRANDEVQARFGVKALSMKKCSRSAHHSLTELNITPLLDLAFVLLVIFIITTVPPVNDMDLKLPDAAKRLKDPPHKANYISIDANGALYLNKKRVADAQDMLPVARGAADG